MVDVSDGDTITVLDDAKVQHKIQLAAIDAPESRQPFGERSRQKLSALVFQIQVEARCQKNDPYGREVVTAGARAMRKGGAASRWSRPERAPGR